MSGINELAIQFFNELVQVYGDQASQYNFATKEILCCNYSNFPINIQLYWTSILLSRLEKQNYGPLKLQSNGLLRQAFYVGIEMLQSFSYSQQVLIFHSSIDLILIDELNECQNLVEVLIVLEPVSHLMLLQGLRYKYLTVARGKVSRFTLKFLNLPKKTSSSIFEFLLVFREFYVFQFEISHITRILVDKLAGFIEEECFYKHNIQIFNECFNIHQMLIEICSDLDQKIFLRNISSKFENSQRLQPQLFPNTPSPAENVGCTVAIGLVSNTITQNSIFNAFNAGNNGSNLSQHVLNVASTPSINLSQVTNQKTLFCNNMLQDGQIKAKIDTACYNGLRLVLKIYEIHESKSKEIPKIEKEIRIYEKFSQLNNSCFLKFHGRSKENFFDPNLNRNIIKIVIFLEYCQKSLSNVIQERAVTRIPFSEFELVDIFHFLLEGFEMMRSLGVLHQDIKPDNILIGSDGKLKIIDFESCFLRTNGASFTGHMASSLVGTHGYLSPEKLNYFLTHQNNEGGDHSYDLEKSDVFSLGLVFYQICYLSNSLYYNQVQDLHDSLNKSQGISLDIKNLILGMLAQNPSQRLNFRGALSLLPRLNSTF